MGFNSDPNSQVSQPAPSLALVQQESRHDAGSSAVPRYFPGTQHIGIVTRIVKGERMSSREIELKLRTIQKEISSLLRLVRDNGKNVRPRDSELPLDHLEKGRHLFAVEVGDDVEEA